MGYIDELKSDLKEAVEKVCPETKEDNTKENIMDNTEENIMDNTEENIMDNKEEKVVDNTTKNMNNKEKKEVDDVNFDAHLVIDAIVAITMTGIAYRSYISHVKIAMPTPEEALTLAAAEWGTHFLFLLGACFLVISYVNVIKSLIKNVKAFRVLIKELHKTSRRKE